MRVLIIADSPYWCWAERAKQIGLHSPRNCRASVIYSGVTDPRYVAFDLYDVVFCMSPQVTVQVRKSMDDVQSKAKLIAGFNSAPERPGQDVYEAAHYADHVISNNYHAWALTQQSRLPATYIPNGVALETFKVARTERPKRVLWIASKGKYNDENDTKRYQSVVRPLELVLPKMGIECDFRVIETGDEMNADQMCEWYNTGQVLLVASKSEGTPNIALEGAACGCVVVTTPVGNMPELIEHERNGVMVIDPVTPNFVDAIKYALKHREALTREMRATIPDWSWQDRVKLYWKTFEAVANGDTTPRNYWREVSA